MGLDWLPGNKPKPGFEAEHEDIIQRILKEDFAQEQSSIGAWFGRFRKSESADKPTEEELMQRFEDISITAFETLSAPRVGHDEKATEWARAQYPEIQTDEPLDAWLKSMDGYYVVSLADPCDGIPKYSNGFPGSHVEPYSFRGQFLTSCPEIIDEDLLERCYVTKTNSDTLAFGNELLQLGHDYASQRGLNVEALDEEDVEGPEFQTDVVISAGKWCVFWAKRGHFLDTWW
ncbi:MAG: hypothetical protein ACR2PM_21135 [Hyphomicrobiales bacterium]